MRAHVLAVVLAVVVLPGAAWAQSHDASVSGSFYRYIPGQPQSPALPGAKVFIRPLGLTSAQWIGPSVTDGYGRFSITAVPAGTYLLRMYIDTNLLWEQQITVSSAVTLPPTVVAVHDASVSVLYYRKKADGTRVSDRLRALGYTFRAEQPSMQTPTNAIWFGRTVPLSDVKLLAASLIEVGVKVQAVRLFHDPDGPKAKLVEVGADAALNGPALTVSQVQSARAFPHDETP
jgi:hypothetical protein